MVSFNEYASTQLRRLCSSVKLEQSCPEFLLLQRFLFGSWGERQMPARPQYRSLIGDDHSPYEFSIAFGPSEIELRLLLETQGDEPSQSANRHAAFELTRRIADIFPISLTRFDAISDLFCPPDAEGPFSLWHAVSFAGRRPPRFKLYFNPQARGPNRSLELVTEALLRLGLPEATRIVSEALAVRGNGLDDLVYFSLDLDDEASARVKVYFSHHAATAAEIEGIFALAPTHQPGDVTSFCRRMVGHAGPFARKPLSSCFSFLQGGREPSAATLHLPIAHYASSDHAVAERVEQFLGEQGEAAAVYRDVLSSYPSRPLPSGTGVQSYTSFRRDPLGLRLTVYLSPGLYHDTAPTSFAAIGTDAQAIGAMESDQ